MERWKEIAKTLPPLTDAEVDRFIDEAEQELREHHRRIALADHRRRHRRQSRFFVLLQWLDRHFR